MRRKSHLFLGRHLAARHMPQTAPVLKNAFLLGCVEPDHNPFTYCKGSLRFQWLRGHNYPNSHSLMHTLIRRLSQARRWNLYHYYSLGKLIHYTADAFTFAHNAHFPDSLKLHREYEDRLQTHFLTCLTEDAALTVGEDSTLMEQLCRLHRSYCALQPSVETDTRFIRAACSRVMTLYHPNREFLPCK